MSGHAAEGARSLRGSLPCHPWTMSTGSRVWSGFRATGHAIFYLVMAGVCVAFIVMGVISVVGRDRATYWGTFTETSTTCDPGPRGSCTNTGRWVSDDGTIVKDGVTLDGFVERGGTIRASYQPGGPMGDDENNIVHTAFWSGSGLWFPWVAATLSAAAIWYQRRRWHRDVEDRQYLSRQSQPAGPKP